MSAPPKSAGATLRDKRQLVEYMEGGAKPPEDWRIGTEHEKFVFRLDDLRRLPYEGDVGIRAVLDGMTRFGWQRVEERGNVIALTDGAGCSISLEPGGQFELSGAPLRTVHETCREVNQHLDQVKQVGEELGIGFLGVGFDPKWARDDVHWMPKGRYKIMREYMPKKGKLGLDMMLRTCTVQVNLDFESEAAMIKKLRVSFALQPIATALFANSPFTEGKPNGYLSYRSHIWTDTDPDRSGMLPFVFDEGMGYERWVDYVLDVPMYFVYRDGTYHDVAGRSFRDFMAGKLQGFEGQFPTMSDWEDHMTTPFPEVRLKRYIEMRGADGGPWRRLCALPALWVGLLYDDAALDAAWDLVKDWSHEEREFLRNDVARRALKTPFRGGTVQDLAIQTLKIARAGLKNRAVLDEFGDDETHFLSALDEIAESGITPAERKLEAYRDRWDESVDPLFREYMY
ncbi:MAG: glutamate--cysteine ligase [Proteobacteria bacterium]|nr:glutamate--cysteine ligase [Pseudomonadota bacterium]